MKKRLIPININQNGFTIVELMIALSVLSVILVLSTLIMIQISSIYTKGVNYSNLQNTNRSIVSDISSDIQFSGNYPASCTYDSNTISDSGTCFASVANVSQPTQAGVPVANYPTKFTFQGSNIYAICIGNVRYSYILDEEDGLDQSTGKTFPHVMWRDEIKNGSSSLQCQPLLIGSSTVAADSESADATGSGNSGGYEVVPEHMRITRLMVYPVSSGSDEYNIDVWMAYGDSDLINTNTAQGGSSSCRGNSGDQFCAVSEISTTVQGRIY